MASDGCHMGGLVAGEVLLPHLKVFRFLGSVQDCGGPWVGFPTTSSWARFPLKGWLAPHVVCQPVCSLGLYLRDGVGGTGSQATHVLPTLNEKVPGQRERIEA